MRAKSIVALGVTAAVAAGGATVAVGQGTGGVLGPKAQGSAAFQLRLTGNSFGVHCADTTNRRRCERDQRPRIGGLSGGSGPVFQGDQRVGRAHFADIVTQRATNRRGANYGALFLATVVLSDGTITLQGASAGGENAPSIPSSITGGTGAYAGARGYATQDEGTEVGNEFRLNVTLTFIP